jgi:hypothetical protein
MTTDKCESQADQESPVVEALFVLGLQVLVAHHFLQMKGEPKPAQVI